MRDAINQWLAGVVTAAVAPAVQTAGVLMDPARVASTGMLRQLWAATRTIADTVYVLFVLAGGLVVLGFETVQTRYTLKQIAPRLLFGWLAANLSWPVITTATQLSAGLALALAGSPLRPADILSQLVAATTTNGPTYLVILAGVIVVLALVLAFTLIVVTALLLVLTVLAPLALCLHALPHTEAIAWCWWRSFTAALAVPTLHALLLALLARVLLAPGGFAIGVFGLPLGVPGPGALLNVLIVIALLWVMIKIPGWALRAATGSTGPRGLLRRVWSTAVLTAGLGALGVPIPAVAARAGLAGGRAGLAALGLQAALRRPTARSTATSRTATTSMPSPRPHPPPSGVAGRGSVNREASGTAPYARIRVGRGGQLLLPLPGVHTHQARPARPPAAAAGRTPSPGPAAAGATTGTRSRSEGRSRGEAWQLRLPLGGDWPEHRPVAGRDGQYRLPLRLPHTRPAPTTPPRRPRTGTGSGTETNPSPPRPGPGPRQLPLPLIWPTPPRRSRRNPRSR